MRFEKFSFGSIRIDGVTHEHDVVIDRGTVRKRKKKPSKQFREAFGHTTSKQTVPVSVSGFRCPRCESAFIIRLPTDEVSSLRAYRCEECGVGLTTPGAKLTFLAVGLVAGGVLAVAAYQLITTEGRWGLGFGLVTVAVVVLGYCFRQLCQPAPRPV